MSTDEPLTKRERQKRRRRQRLEAEETAAERVRRRRLAVLASLVVIGLAAVGVVVQGQLAERAAQRERVADAAARLGDLGCTGIEELPDLGAGHLAATPQALAAAPPAQLYPDRPTASGQHIGRVVASGVYDRPVDERLTTHNLEHGYVVFWYDEDAEDTTVEALRSWAQDRIDGDFPKVIAAPYFEALPGEADVVATAWGVRQSCEQFDADVAQIFLDEHYGLSGEAPEKAVAPHRQGEGVPGPGSDEGLLLPPLDKSTSAAPPRAAQGSGPSVQA